MVVLKTSRELKAMREAGRISANALKLAGEAVEPGITTWEIDEIVRKYIEGQEMCIRDSAYSEAAKQKIEAAGGKAEVI